MLQGIKKGTLKVRDKAQGLKSKAGQLQATTMESILATALQSKLKYYIKDYKRDQFRLTGRVLTLGNLDLNGDVLHAIIGLPPTLKVAKAQVDKLEIKLPNFSTITAERTVVSITTLHLVLKETDPNEPPVAPSSASTAKSTSYGLADKIADGMTVEVGQVNLILETRGGSSVSGHGTAAWIPPICGITMKGLVLSTTNEHWQEVDLNETREFFRNSRCIYIFKKLIWESLSVELLPHPDMFSPESVAAGESFSSRGNDGARRTFFSGEQLVDNVSGHASVTMHRTDTNNPLGLEVDLQLSEIICPDLSEPGLRALMRFMTGMYGCLTRGDVKPPVQAEAAGKSYITASLDNVFFRIKDPEYQLEVILNSLHYTKGSIGNGDVIQSMSRLYLGNMFLRDTFSAPPVTLVQPRHSISTPAVDPVPNFASEKLWPRVYPLPVAASEVRPLREVSMLRLYSASTVPPPPPPALAAQLVVDCSPIQVNLHEQSCFRIASLLADGTMVASPTAPVTPPALQFVRFRLAEFDLSVPVPSREADVDAEEAEFTGARLHVEGLQVSQDPSFEFALINVEADPACYLIWKDQPFVPGQVRYTVKAGNVSVALETGAFDDSAQPLDNGEEKGASWRPGLWQCVEIAGPACEMLMISADGTPLSNGGGAPPGGVVRLGLHCSQYSSNTSRVQLLFVLRMYSYIARVCGSLVKVSRGKEEVNPAEGLGSVAAKAKSGASLAELASLAPADSKLVVALQVLQVRLLESVPGAAAQEGPLLAQLYGADISIQLSHASLGGAAAINSKILWRDIRVECLETEVPGGDSEEPTAPAVEIPAKSSASLPVPEASGGQAGAWNPFDDDHESNPLSGSGTIDDTNPFDVDDIGGELPSGGQADKINPFDGEDESNPAPGESEGQTGSSKVLPQLRSIMWKGAKPGSMAGNLRGIPEPPGRLPFVEVETTQVVPYDDAGGAHTLRATAKVGGVRLGGGMAFNEALLQKYGLLAPDGSPGAELLKILALLGDGGQLSELMRGPQVSMKSKASKKAKAEPDSGEESRWERALPQELDIDFQLLDWLFALEGAEGVQQPVGLRHLEVAQARQLAVKRGDKSWHTTFRALRVTAHSGGEGYSREATQRSSSPVQAVLIRLEGVQALKPRFLEAKKQADDAEVGKKAAGRHSVGGADTRVSTTSGLDVEIKLKEEFSSTPPGLAGAGGKDNGEWTMKAVRVAIREPVEVETTKEDVAHLATLCESEVAAASRIVAAGLKLLQAQGTSIATQSTIDQLLAYGKKVVTPLIAAGAKAITGKEVSPDDITRKIVDSAGALVPKLVPEEIEAALARSRQLCQGLAAHVATDGAASERVAELASQLAEMQALLSKGASELLE